MSSDLISSPQFSQISKNNRWSKGQENAKDRLAKGYTIPEWHQTFKLSTTDRIFTIGSCFARNIEKALLLKKIKVSSANPNSDILELRTNLLTGLLNKYNPISIHQELEWACGHREFPSNGYINLENQYIDPSLRNQSRKGNLDFVKNRKRLLQQYFSQCFTANCVIITLGLTETWVDLESHIALAETPSPRLLKEYPSRFACKILSYSECEKILNSIYLLLGKYGENKQRMIITVSPVPMERTFSGQDILVANLTSKSTLRAAAYAFAEKHTGVDYFPSYEAVTLAEPDIAWLHDRRTVKDGLVQEIMNRFIQDYELNDLESP